MKIRFASFVRILSAFSSKAPLFFWYRHYKTIFFLGFLIVLGLGSWQWYYSLYRYQWSADEKKQYLETYAKETSFKEGRFRETVSRMKARAESHVAPVVPHRDIFTVPVSEQLPAAAPSQTITSVSEPSSSVSSLPTPQ